MKYKLNLITILSLIFIILPACSRKISPGETVDEKTVTYDTTRFEYYYVDGIRSKLLGNTGDALNKFEQCLKQNPESDATCFQIAQILFAIGDGNGSKKYALRAQELAPGNIWYNMMLASTYYRENNLDSALIFYNKAVKDNPERPDILVTLANLYSAKKEYSKAESIYESLDKEYGINGEYTIGEINNYVNAGMFGKALEKTEQLISEFPENVSYNILLARIYSETGDNDKAMSIYQDLLKKNPDDAETQLSLCDLLISEKKYDDLFRMLNGVVINDNISIQDRNILFNRLIGINELTTAYGAQIELLLRIYEAANKNNDLISLLRPDLYVAENRLTEAEARLKELIRQNENNYYAWEKLLLVYLSEGNYKDLETQAEICTKKFSRSFIARLLYATAAAENKHYNIAISELGQAETLTGGNKQMMLQVLSQRADVYYRMNDYDKAFKTFDEALKNDDSDLTILNNYAYYLAEQNTRLKEAETMARKVIEKEGTNNTFLDTYAWVLYKRGRIREAEKVMETIIKNDSVPDAEYYEHYGYILKKKNDCKNAIINWNIALKLDSSKTGLIKEIAKCQEK